MHEAAIRAGQPWINLSAERDVREPRREQRLRQQHDWPGADPAYVNLKVREQEHDSVTHFRMKRVTQLKKVPSSLAHS